METILKSNYNNKEIIIVDDCSDENHRLEEFIKNIDLDIKLIRIDKEEKGNIINPCYAYNKGFEAATGDVVIIQNSECIHIGDICKFVNDNIKNNNYLSFTCMPTHGFDINDKLYEIFKNNDSYDKDILKYCEENFFNKKIFWFNHPSRATNYHFLTAITKENLDKLGGFDQRYKFRHSWDDDDFIQRIRYILKLKVMTYDPINYPFTIHLIHAKHKKFLTQASNYSIYEKRMRELKIPLNLFVEGR